jgi:hypothetical protein
MTPVATTFHTPHRVAHRHTTSEPPVVRRLLIGVALGFLSLFLFLPLVFVFTQAFAKGIGFYFHTLHDPMAWSAIKLTFTAAVIAVPLNCVFGVCAAWLIAKFDFRGKNILLTLIDLPFSVSPVIAGLIYVLVFGAQGWLGLYKNADNPKFPWLANWHFRRAGNCLGDDFCDVPVRRPRVDSAHAGAGPQRRGSRARARRERLADFLACDFAQYQMGFALRRDFMQRPRDGRIRRGGRRERPDSRADQHDSAAH